MSVVRPFDPWRNPLCTCPPKYGLNPYTGCGHGCLYCYATSYVPSAQNPRPKKDLVRRVLRDLERVQRGSLITIANSSDPYTPPEDRLGLTRRVLQLVLERGYRVVVITKSSLVLRDLDVLQRYRGRAVVQVTITTLKSDLAAVLEPGAPRPPERLEAVRRTAAAGVPVSVRLDPLIPYINDDPENVESVISAASRAGASHVVVSTYKARRDNFARLARAFPDLASLWRRLYFIDGTYFHGQWYAPESYRAGVLGLAASVAEKYGVAFTVCREGFAHLSAPGSRCDGSHLMPARG